MKYIYVFVSVSALVVALLTFGAVITGTVPVAGHIALALGSGAIGTLVYWLFDNEPPQDNQDRATYLWRG